MGKIFRYDYGIPFFESDVTARVKLSHLVNICLHVSGLQGMALGMSDQKVFDDYGLIWVVTDYDIAINRLPRFGETITIETQALSYNKLFCYREFRILDGQDLLARLLVSFVLMDAQTRKVHPVIDELVAVFGGVKEKKLTRGPKYPQLDQAPSLDKQVSYLDLDMNGHVNNSKYIDWLFEGLDLDFVQSHQLTQANIHYSKEIHYGKQIRLVWKQEGLTSLHQIESSEGVHAQAILEWEETEKND